MKVNLLNELISEGEQIRSDLVTALETNTKVKRHWDTVVHWYVEALAYAKENSARAPLEEFLDPSSDTNAHHKQIDRLLSRLQGIRGSKNSG